MSPATPTRYLPGPPALREVRAQALRQLLADIAARVGRGA